MTVHGDKLVKEESLNAFQFQCPNEECGKKFLDNAKLKRHMLVHTVSLNFNSERVRNLIIVTFVVKSSHWTLTSKPTSEYTLERNPSPATSRVVTNVSTRSRTCMLTC